MGDHTVPAEVLQNLHPLLEMVCLIFSSAELFNVGYLWSRPPISFAPVVAFGSAVLGCITDQLLGSLLSQSSWNFLPGQPVCSDAIVPLRHVSHTILYSVSP